MKVNWSTFHTPYKEFQVNKYVPREAGIYLLWVKLKNTRWSCFYVGQARNLETRLLEHLSSEEENECIEENVSKYICGFEYAKISKESDRDGIEKYLYDCYSPECKKVDPGGKAIEVNLP